MPTKKLEDYSKSEQKLMAEFGARVQKLRKAVGLSQEKLAEHTDVHRTYISGIERGRQNISLITMKKLAKALSVEMEKLVGGL